MGKLKLLKSGRVSHPLDDPRNWTKPGVFIMPDFDLEGYQAKIDKIVPRSASGQPVVRIKWAWDCRKWENYEWDSFGNATKGEWRQKYRAITIELPNDEYVDISPPRFVLEERFEPGQYEHSWELTRYYHDPESCSRCSERATMLRSIMVLCGNRDLVPDHDALGCTLCYQTLVQMERSTTCARRDIWGPYPREGWYSLLAAPAMSVPFGVVADHDQEGKCCQKLWNRSREICYGRFRFPDQRELRVLERAVALRNKDVEVDPHSVTLNPRALTQAKALGLQSAQDVKVARRTELKEMYADEVAVHGAGVITPQAILGLKEARRRVPVNRIRFT